MSCSRFGCVSEIGSENKSNFGSEFQSNDMEDSNGQETLLQVASFAHHCLLSIAFLSGRQKDFASQDDFFVPKLHDGNFASYLSLLAVKRKILKARKIRERSLTMRSLDEVNLIGNSGTYTWEDPFLTFGGNGAYKRTKRFSGNTIDTPIQLKTLYQIELATCSKQMNLRFSLPCHHKLLVSLTTSNTPSLQRFLQVGSGKEVAMEYPNKIPDNYFDDHKCPSYSLEKLDEVCCVYLGSVACSFGAARSCYALYLLLGGVLFCQFSGFFSRGLVFSLSFLRSVLDRGEHLIALNKHYYSMTEWSDSLKRCRSTDDR
ncbi:hypothetical protein L195_g018192, partial [Trifolium pratense]